MKAESKAVKHLRTDYTEIEIPKLYNETYIDDKLNVTIRKERNEEQLEQKITYFYRKSRCLNERKIFFKITR